MGEKEDGHQHQLWRLKRLVIMLVLSVVVAAYKDITKKGREMMRVWRWCVMSDEQCQAGAEKKHATHASTWFS